MIRKWLVLFRYQYPDIAEERMIRSRLDGMTPPEIFHEFQRQRIAMHRNYVYAVLARLESRGLIQQRNGRYVAAPQRTQAEGKLFKVS